VAGLAAGAGAKMLSISAMGARVVSRDITRDDRHKPPTVEAPLKGQERREAADEPE
jgi:hypothetical protein